VAKLQYESKDDAVTGSGRRDGRYAIRIDGNRSGLYPWVITRSTANRYTKGEFG
jgi:hypothetical protein